MTSRSDFARELAALQNQLDSLPKPVPPTAQNTPRPASLETLLDDYGLKLNSLEDVWDRLNAELDGVPQNKPLLTALAALGIGYLLGRVTR